MSEFDEFSGNDSYGSMPSAPVNPGSVKAALIMEIIAIVLIPVSCCCTYTGFVALILAIISLVLAIKAKSAMKANYGTVTGLCTATFIMGIISVILGVGITIYDIISIIINIKQMVDHTNPIYNMLMGN